MNQQEISDVIWDASNEIQELSCKLHSLSDLLELLAERVSSDPESGSIWLARDTALALSEKFDECSMTLIPAMRAVQQLNISIPKKGKK